MLKIRQYNPYDELVLCDIRFLPFKENCADFLIAFEVIEHLRKDDALMVLRSLPTLSNKIFVSMPYGYYPQHEMRGNMNEEHLSSWHEEDLETLCYKAEKTGLNLDLELIAKKFRIYDLFHSVLRRRYGKPWVGAMLIGIWQKNKQISIKENTFS